MSNELIKVELKIQNKKGLHARAAAAFVKTIEDIDADINVERAGQTVSGCSIMGLMMFAAAKDSTIIVTASGNEAAKAIEALTTLVNNKFGEE